MYLKEYVNKENVLAIMNVLENKGLDKSAAVSLISNNLQILMLGDNKVNDKISIIFNNQDVYAALYCSGDDYKWSIYKNGEFNPFSNENYDYVIEMILSSVSKAKMRQLFVTDGDSTQESDIKAYRDSIDDNQQGYCLK